MVFFSKVINFCFLFFHQSGVFQVNLLISLSVILSLVLCLTMNIYHPLFSCLCHQHKQWFLELYGLVLSFLHNKIFQWLHGYLVHVTLPLACLYDFASRGMSAFVYHGKEKPFDIQSRKATVWPGMNFMVLSSIFLILIIHLFVFN